MGQARRIARIGAYQRRTTAQRYHRAVPCWGNRHAVGVRVALSTRHSGTAASSLRPGPPRPSPASPAWPLRPHRGSPRSTRRPPTHPKPPAPPTTHPPHRLTAPVGLTRAVTAGVQARHRHQRHTRHHRTRRSTRRALPRSRPGSGAVGVDGPHLHPVRTPGLQPADLRLSVSAGAVDHRPLRGLARVGGALEPAHVVVGHVGPAGRCRPPSSSPPEWCRRSRPRRRP